MRSHHDGVSACEALELRRLFSGMVTGRVIEDRHLASAVNEEEPIDGVRVYVDLDQDGRLDAGEPRTRTNARGEYRMQHVPYGEQRVVQQTPKGYVNTTDDDYRSVVVPRNGEVRVEPFFNEPDDDGVAIVAGTSADDLIEVRSTRSRIIVTVNGRERSIRWKEHYFLLIYGRGGDDRIVITEKGFGLPYVFGGTGNDTILGSSEAEFLSGDEGHDRIDGAGGGDLIVGGTGDDTLWGRGGDDLMAGEEGDDALHGNAGKDTLVGFDPGDSLFGGTGADWPKHDVVPCGDGFNCRNINPFLTSENVSTPLGRRRG